MARIRTTEQLQEWLKKEKEKRLKQQKLKKEKEIQKYKKAREENKKLIQRKKNKEKTIPIIEEKTIQYHLTIYHSNEFEREPREKELYTMDELKNIEKLYPEEEGRINWRLWDKLVKNFNKF